MANSTKILKEKLRQDGHFFEIFGLNDSIKRAVLASDYNSIDAQFQILTSSDGVLYTYLSQFCDFNSIEFIISLRDSKNEWEEDGIWHDDGSRALAFSLSLTINSATLEGGELHFRKKGLEEVVRIKPFEYGEILVFKTGTSGYEHKIHAVEKGQRLIIAGWCS
jgi:hypothetical protein